MVNQLSGSMVERPVRGHGRPRLLAACLFAGLAAFTQGAMAQPDPGSTRGAPADPDPGLDVAIHHAPVSVVERGQPVPLRARIEAPHRVSRVDLHIVQGGRTQVYPFQRTTGGYVATVPASETRTDFSYFITFDDLQQKRWPVFASSEQPYPVRTMEAEGDRVERLIDERLGHRRSVAAFRGEYVSFGETPGGCSDPSAEACAPIAVDDRYLSVEGAYRYRLHRTVASFAIRGGVVRGSSVGAEGEAQEVGLNYGAPSVRLRLAQGWYLDLEGLASITEVGFSVGGGSALLLGDPYGTSFTVGTEVIGLKSETYFGSRFFTRVTIAAHERVRLSPSIEVSDFPHADRYGVRLLADAKVGLFGGWSATARAGYQARERASGGPALGLGVESAF